MIDGSAREASAPGLWTSRDEGPAGRERAGTSWSPRGPAAEPGRAGQSWSRGRALLLGGRRQQSLTEAGATLVTPGSTVPDPAPRPCEVGQGEWGAECGASVWEAGAQGCVQRLRASPGGLSRTRREQSRPTPLPAAQPYAPRSQERNPGPRQVTRAAEWGRAGARHAAPALRSAVTFLLSGSLRLLCWLLGQMSPAVPRFPRSRPWDCL